MCRFPDDRRSPGELARFRDGEIFLSHMASIRVDRSQKIRVVVQDYRYPVWPCERQHRSREPNDFTLRMSFRSQLNEIDSAQDQLFGYPNDIGGLYIAKIDDPVQRSVHCFISNGFRPTIFSTKLVSKFPRIKSAFCMIFA